MDQRRFYQENLKKRIHTAKLKRKAKDFGTRYETPYITHMEWLVNHQHTNIRKAILR